MPRLMARVMHIPGEMETKKKVGIKMTRAATSIVVLVIGFFETQGRARRC
jgi:hypothetical protein